jgi:hypothetical protein
MTFFCSTTIKSHVTSFIVEHLIRGNLNPCSQAMVTYIWCRRSYFLISFKAESLFYIHTNWPHCPFLLPTPSISLHHILHSAHCMKPWLWFTLIICWSSCIIPELPGAAAKTDTKKTKQCHCNFRVCNLHLQSGPWFLFFVQIFSKLLKFLTMSSPSFSQEMTSLLRDEIEASVSHCHLFQHAPTSILSSYTFAWHFHLRLEPISFLSLPSSFFSFLPSFLSFSLFSKPQRIPSLGEHSNFYNFRRLSKKILLLSCSPVFTTHS